MSLFRRLHPIKCFYCQSTIASSSNSPSFPAFGSSSSSSNSFDPSQFRCPHCGCWNRYNSQGEIIGYEPAMHDEHLNIDSFSKRGEFMLPSHLVKKLKSICSGSPDRNHLPSVYRNSNSRFFCHTCQTNQTLLVNLLSNYLPSPDDPSYNSRIDALPDYTASLQLRYPPVCSSCLPAVEEEISRKDEMARTRALAGALKASKPRDNTTKKLTSGQMKKRAKIASWRVRGAFWLMNLLSVVAGYIFGTCNTMAIAHLRRIPDDASAVLDYRIPPTLVRCVALCPMIAMVSLSWIFWDPTYSLQRRSNFQGRQVRVEGRNTYYVSSARPA